MDLENGVSPDRLRYAKWANRSRRRGLLLISLSILIVAAPLISLQAYTVRQFQETEQKVSSLDKAESHPGAAALVESWHPSDSEGVPAIPLPSQVDREWGSFPENCSDEFDLPFEEHEAGCTRSTVEHPDRVVLVVGDSHAQQWLAPLESIAAEEHWQIYAFLKGGCSLSIREISSFDDETFGNSCISWMNLVMAQIEEMRPDIVISVGTRTASVNVNSTIEDGGSEHIPAGLEAAVNHLTDLGIPTVLLRDNPRFTFNAYECALAVQEHSVEEAANFTANPDCGVSRDQAYASVNPVSQLFGLKVAGVDMSDFICDEDNCPAVIGNVYVYLDTNHLTSAYARSMTPYLAPRLIEAVELVSG